MWRVAHSISVRSAEASTFGGSSSSRSVASSDRGSDIDDAEDESDEEERFLTASRANDRLFDLLVSLKLVGKLTARDVCGVAYLVKAAGLSGRVAELALPASRKDHSHHFDVVTGLAEEMGARHIDVIHVPCYRNSFVGREYIQHSVLLAYDALSNEIASTMQFESKLRKVNESFGDVFWSHPLVQASPDSSQCVPIAVYQDGVTYSWDRRGGCTGTWNISSVTQKRHLVTVSPKRLKWRCGCKGWCDWHAFHQYVAWNFEVMASGVYPDPKWDGSRWACQEMASLLGQPLGYVPIAFCTKAIGASSRPLWAFQLGIPRCIHASCATPCV